MFILTSCNRQRETNATKWRQGGQRQKAILEIICGRLEERVVTSRRFGQARMGDLEIAPKLAGADQGPKPTRREILQRLLGGMVAGAVFPAISPSHPIYRLMADGVTFDRAERLR